LYDEAIRQLQPFIASGKAIPSLYADLGRILSDGKGDYEAALDVLTQGYEKSKRDFGVVNNLAYVYLLLGDAKAARSILEAFVPSNDSDKEVPTAVVMTATWGLLHLVEGDLELGQEFYNEAKRLASTLGNKELARLVSQKMHLELARAFYRAGDRSVARKHLQQGLAIRDGMDFYHRDLQILDKNLRLSE